MRHVDYRVVLMTIISLTVASETEASKLNHFSNQSEKVIQAIAIADLPQPDVTSVSPQIVAPGDQVTIKGRNFYSGNDKRYELRIQYNERLRNFSQRDNPPTLYAKVVGRWADMVIFEAPEGFVPGTFKIVQGRLSGDRTRFDQSGTDAIPYFGLKPTGTIEGRVQVHGSNMILNADTDIPLAADMKNKLIKDYCYLILLSTKNTDFEVAPDPTPGAGQLVKAGDSPIRFAGTTKVRQATKPSLSPGGIKAKVGPTIESGISISPLRFSFENFPLFVEKHEYGIESNTTLIQIMPMDLPNKSRGSVKITNDRGPVELGGASGEFVYLPPPSQAVIDENFRTVRRGQVVRIRGRNLSPSPFFSSEAGERLPRLATQLLMSNGTRIQMEQTRHSEPFSNHPPDLDFRIPPTFPLGRFNRLTVTNWAGPCEVEGELTVTE
jgi:hypothetical protein